MQRFSGGTPASACSTCRPQPAHVAFPHFGHFTWWHIGRGFCHGRPGGALPPYHRRVPGERKPSRRRHREPVKTPLGRLFELGSLAARAGASTALTGVAGLLRSAPSRQARNRAELVRNAERLVETLGDMKGAAMKVGQMLSLHDAILPPDVAAVLRTLQKTTSSLPFEAIEEQLVRELGNPLDHFARFEEQGFAAASIGQVHRAVYRDGRQVAVKVQYPGIDRIVAADLANLKRVLKSVVSLVTKVDVRPIWQELKARLVEELDYLNEAENLRRMAALWADEPRVVVPRVVPEATTRRVLTMEYVTGLSPDEACSEATPQETRDRWGEVLFLLLVRGLLEHRLLHADPNIANFAFRTDGSVVVYDLGCVKAVPEPLARGYRALCRAALDRRHEAIPGLLHGMGLHLSDGRPYSGVLVDPYLALVDDLLRPSPPYRFGVDGTVYGKLIDAARAGVAKASDLRFPSDIVFVNRTALGHLGNLSRLKAAGPWRYVLEAVVGR